MIADLQRPGEGVRAIAVALGRSPPTISRELRRNQQPAVVTRLSDVVALLQARWPCQAHACAT